MLRSQIRTLLCGGLLALTESVFIPGATSRAQTPDADERNVLVVTKKAAPVPPFMAMIPAGPAMGLPADFERGKNGTPNKGSGKTSRSTPEGVSTKPSKANDGKTAGPGPRFTALDVPVKFQAFYLGDVSVRMSSAGEVNVKIGSLTKPLKKIMKMEAIQRVVSCGEPAARAFPPHACNDSVARAAKGQTDPSFLPAFVTKSHGVTSGGDGGSEDGDGTESPEGNDEYLPLSIIKGRGLDIRYDSLASELIVTPSIDQRLEGNLSLGHENTVPISANAQKPAFFSAYLNTRMSLDYVAQSATAPKGLTDPNFDFDGAVRIGPLVFESEASLTSRSPSAGGNAAAYDLTRRGTRLIYDAPRDIVRYKAGDLSPAFTGFQSSPSLLGVSAERFYSQLHPGQNIRPTGQHSFRIERPSNVDILIDGAILRRLHLQPGSYNINDLPLKPGATKITLIIEEDTGARRTLDFTNFAGQDLLATGIDEWQIAGGVQASPALGQGDRGIRDAVTYSEPDYLWNRPAVTGFYRTGVTPTLTASAHAQADSRVAMAGAGISAGTPYGYISIDAAASFQTASGAGFAVRSAYELIDLQDSSGGSQSLRLSAELQTAAFATVNDYAAPRDYGLNLAVLYSKNLTEDISASLSGALYLSRRQLTDIDKWAIDLTISKRLSDALSGAISVGYSQDAHPTYQICACQSDPDYPGVRTLARVSYRPDAVSSLALSEDVRAQTSRATYQSTSADGAWNAFLDAAHEGPAHSADIGASIGYSGNRGEIALSHATRLEGLSASQNVHSADERTSLRLESGIATADGAWSFGRPIRNSFAIVETHESLGDRNLTLGPKEKEIGRSDFLAPALLPDINPYIQRRVEFDVDNLPLGYDLGAGAFDFLGPYKSGYRVQAGSSYTVTAIGTLAGEDGHPISLLGGTAREVGRKDGARIQLFTNKAGRFGAQGLAPGSWIIDIETEPEPTRFLLDIPPGTTGLFQAGLLRPSQK